jgi:hypothetical protein
MKTEQFEQLLKAVRLFDASNLRCFDDNIADTESSSVLLTQFLFSPLLVR